MKKHRLTLRSQKDCGLTWAEMDSNFAFLQTENEELKRRVSRIEKILKSAGGKPA